MVVDFLANPKLAEYDLSSLERVSGGGAAMPAAVGERLQQLIGSPYIEGYGLTETIAPTHINPVDRPKRQCLGIPIFNTDSRVIDPESLKELPSGQVGEIVSTVRRSSRAIGAMRKRRRRRSSRSTARSFSAPAILAMWMRRVTSFWSIG